MFPRRARWLLITFLVTVFIIGYNILKSLYPVFNTPRFDLRKQNNLPIILPVTEPQGVERDLSLLIIVSSSPNKEENARKREMLRRTWGSMSSNKDEYRWKVLFMMGKTLIAETDKSIMAEHRRYGDLLIGDYHDSYRTITTKLLMAFNWASKKRFKYILKTDDDVYVNIPKLINWIVTQGNPSSFYGGILYRGNVVRNSRHKHYVSKEDLPIDHYPVYCKGAMFVMSQSLVSDVTALSTKIPRIPVDDAYVGLLVNHLEVTPTEIPGFFQKSYLHWFVSFISSCQFKEIVGIGDSLTPRQMNYIHQEMNSASTSENLSSFCISLHMKLFIFVFLCAVSLLVLLLYCRIKFRRWKLSCTGC